MSTLHVFFLLETIQPFTNPTPNIWEMINEMILKFISLFQLSHPNLHVSSPVFPFFWPWFCASQWLIEVYLGAASTGISILTVPLMMSNSGSCQALFNMFVGRNSSFDVWYVLFWGLHVINAKVEERDLSYKKWSPLPVVTGTGTGSTPTCIYLEESATQGLTM